MRVYLIKRGTRQDGEAPARLLGAVIFDPAAPPFVRVLYFNRFSYFTRAPGNTSMSVDVWVCYV
jgi:hypothetical protein